MKGNKTDRSIITTTALNANQFVPATQLEILAESTGLEYIRVQFDLPSNLTKMDDCGKVDELAKYVEHSFKAGEGKEILDKVVEAIRFNL